MKKLIPLLAFLVLLWCAAGASGQNSLLDSALQESYSEEVISIPNGMQITRQYVRHGTGAPSSCPAGTVYVDDATGFTYVNKAGSCFLSGGGATPPGGSNTQVQFNDSGVFGGDAGLVYNKTTDAFTVNGSLVLNGSTSGSATLTATPIAGTPTILLPALSGTAIVTGTGANAATRVAALGLNTSAGSSGSLKFGAGGAAITTLQGSGGAAAWTMTLPVGAGSSGQYLQTDGAGVTSWQTVSAGVTNSAGANVIPKSNGTNLVASQITDDGSDVNIGGLGNVTGTADAAGTASLTTGLVTIQADGGNSRARLLADTESIVIDGSAHTIINTTPSWSTGAGGTELEIDGSGFITTYGGQNNPDNGDLLIGDGTKFVRDGLTAGAGISITNGAGSITIAQDGSSPKKASIALTSQSASIGATNIQVDGGVAPAGLYRLSYYLVTTTAGTSGTVSATFGWSDIAAARTSGTGNITFGTLASPAAGTVIIQANGVANITYLTTVTAAVGSPVYALNVTLERLQ
jgi:hypothetical protein